MVCVIISDHLCGLRQTSVSRPNPPLGHTSSPGYYYFFLIVYFFKVVRYTYYFKEVLFSFLW